MKYYAQINENNICINILSTPNNIYNENMIELYIFDTDILGKIYNRDTNEWEENIEEIIETFNIKKQNKLQEISNSCQQTIYQGLLITLSNQEQKQFSFKEEDQINLTTAYNMIKTGQLEQFPYHSNGELCEYYSATDIIIIAEILMNFKTYHITYCNSLNVWINSLTEEDEDTLDSIYYGIEIPEELQSEVLKTLNSSIS